MAGSYPALVAGFFLPCPWEVARKRQLCADRSGTQVGCGPEGMTEATPAPSHRGVHSRTQLATL